MSALEALIRRRIAQQGPMPLAEYMGLCLGHPAHGYYATRDPLGAAGDFTTAPEVSQMFGELLGLWLARVWQEMGAPSRVVLAELGPGRGTLMADALRAAERVPGFLLAAEPWLVETSPALRARQAETLAGRGARWADRAEALPEGPLLLVANEFFDALPVRQLVRARGRWRERVVGLEGERLVLGLGAVVPWEEEAPKGATRELRPAAEGVGRWLGARLAATGGGAVIVDYGYFSCPAEGGDTFQAVRGHAYADPLDAPGEADLTAHVDFAALARAAQEGGAQVWPAVTQGLFLERLGVTERARALARAASAAPASPGPCAEAASVADPVEAIIAAHRRLTHPEEMGELFKVLALTGPGQPRPPGV